MGAPNSLWKNTISCFMSLPEMENFLKVVSVFHASCELE